MFYLRCLTAKVEREITEEEYVKEVEKNGEKAYYCESCKMIFPVKEGEEICCISCKKTENVIDVLLESELLHEYTARGQFYRVGKALKERRKVK